MAVIVSIRKVVDEIGTAYLNRKTGELDTLQGDDEELVADDADLEDLPDWQRDAIPVIREILESEDWLALPTKFEIQGLAPFEPLEPNCDFALERILSCGCCSVLALSHRPKHRTSGCRRSRSLAWH